MNDEFCDIGKFLYLLLSCALVQSILGVFELEYFVMFTVSNEQ